MSSREVNSRISELELKNIQTIIIPLEEETAVEPSLRETVSTRINNLIQTVNATSRWVLPFEGFDAQRGPAERAREVRSFLTNGNITARFDATGNAVVSKAKGVFARDTEKDIAGPSEPGFGLDLGNIFSINIDNGNEQLDKSKITNVTRELDTLHDSLTTRFTWIDSGERKIDISIKDILSYPHPHLSLREYSFTPKFNGRITIETGIRGRRPVTQEETEFIKTADSAELPDKKGIFYEATTISHADMSDNSIAIGQKSKAYLETGNGSIEIQTPQIDRKGKREIDEKFVIDVEEGHTYTIRTIKAIVTSQNPELNEGEAPRDLCLQEIKNIKLEDFDALAQAHSHSREESWGKSPLFILGAPDVQEALRFNRGNLKKDVRLGYTNAAIGAKQANEEKKGYRDAAFHDIEESDHETFDSDPEMIKTLLDYRYALLPDARRKAKEVLNEFRLNQTTTPEEYIEMVRYNEKMKDIDEGGHMPWEAGSPTPSGKNSNPEQGPQFLIREAKNEKGEVIKERVRVHALNQEILINAEITNAILHYYRLSNDEEWMRTKGAEMILSFARYYANRLTPVWQKNTTGEEEIVQYRLLQHTDPNEYHMNINDGAFTLYMIKRTQMAAISLLKSNMVAPEVLARLGIEKEFGKDNEEISKWEDIVSKLKSQFNPYTKEFTAFDGAENLTHIDLTNEQYRGVTEMDKKLLHEGKNPEEYEVFKQPGATMLLELQLELFELFTPDELEMMGVTDATPEELQQIFAEIVSANIAKHDAQTSDGSSLSPGRRRLHHLLDNQDPYLVFQEYKQKTLFMDLLQQYNTHRTEEGIHTANEGLASMVFTYGFLGIFHGKDALHTAPRLPDEIQGVYYETTYRGERVGMLYDGENEVEIFIENPSREAMLRGIPVNASGMKMLLNEENGYYFSSREEKMKQQPQAA